MGSNILGKTKTKISSINDSVFDKLARKAS